jgi:hypothetical protein
MIGSLRKYPRRPVATAFPAPATLGSFAPASDVVAAPLPAFALLSLPPSE